ncbi:MAG: AAA family ATPase [Thaumarchaeota archaeon]|nr:AAA family ATPase [Nitrososphaerota archaeon]
MDAQELEKIIHKVESKEKFFKKKSLLDTLSYPDKILGREKQTEELVTYLLGYKTGLVVPLISIYGRTGSGKSTIVKFVCDNLKDVSYCFVNLRKARTIFGFMNLILGELGQPNLKNANGITLLLENIEKTIESKVKSENKKLFVLALDEFDMLFYDKRGKPSDFIYKLLLLEDNLKAKGVLMCIVCISNNVLSEYDLEDRVRSRIGSSEIFFEPYSQKDVKEILQQRASEALDDKIEKDYVLDYCAEKSSLGHGDARRAIDLLRVAAEIAAINGKKITLEDIDLADDKLQQDRIDVILHSASYHLKVTCFAIARLAYLTGEEWLSTFVLYHQYTKLLSKNIKPLTYRRISELLTELENTGLVKSHTMSKGRQGYGTEYKLTFQPSSIGMRCFPELWFAIAKEKFNHDSQTRIKSLHSGVSKSSSMNNMDFLTNNSENLWKNYVENNQSMDL